ncbi:gametogenetin-binding protein 2-like [Teleopsis dalmanni]|uniref:gametogenetin-binding protein 2-like n=1 Tax=Teleopsis dalmanni TaxID=139649 RepID=UPI0018CE445A|nr:gametogenetin-binding protein 2-like [Teleopsis dalmanni]
MARLALVYRPDAGEVGIGRRQLPVLVQENLMMLMDLNHKGLCFDKPYIFGKELDEFKRKFKLLSSDELRESLEIDGSTFVSVLNQCVQCVGCRRRVERLFYQLTLSGHPTLDPLVFKNSCILTVSEEKLKTPQFLGTLLHRHHEVLNNLIENKLRNKTRCVLHSLDTFRTKPFSETWREVWASMMKNHCRDELAIIDTVELHDVLENYLKKHKFCQGCRTKIEKAYKLLIGEVTQKEKGFVAALYANIKKCHPEKHIHIPTRNVDFLDALIRRAEPEVNGSYSKQRERHAKTLEIAQEEVLTCVGMILYERLRLVYVSLREEERACQVLAAVGVHALCRSFDMSVEKKRGISNLELLYQEISRAEKAKEHKKELKKLKRKKKKDEKKNVSRESESGFEESDEPKAEDELIDDDVSIGNESIKDETLYMDDDKLELLSVDKENNFDSSIPILSKNQQMPKLVLKKNKKKQKVQFNNTCKKLTVSSPSPEPDKLIINVSTEKCWTECLIQTPDCPCGRDIKDSGYGSEPNSQENSRMSSIVSSPEGSEVSCSEGFCNHEHVNGHELEDDVPLQHCGTDLSEQLLCRGGYLSLQQMVDEYFDEDEENYYIPNEVVLEFKCQEEKVQQKIQMLRKTLKDNFDRLYAQKSRSVCK